MAAITFPAYGKLQTTTYSHTSPSSVYVSPMESGPTKMAKRSSENREEHSLTYLFSNDEYQLFLDWYHNTADQGAAWFNWINPITEEVIDGRIKNADYHAVPVTNQFTHWFVSMVIEHYQ